MNLRTKKTRTVKQEIVSGEPQYYKDAKRRRDDEYGLYSYEHGLIRHVRSIEVMNNVYLIDCCVVLITDSVAEWCSAEQFPKTTMVPRVKYEFEAENFRIGESAI